jgi:hypothetical protein
MRLLEWITTTGRKWSIERRSKKQLQALQNECNKLLYRMRQRLSKFHEDGARHRSYGGASLVPYDAQEAARDLRILAAEATAFGGSEAAKFGLFMASELEKTYKR